MYLRETEYQLQSTQWIEVFIYQEVRTGSTVVPNIILKEVQQAEQRGKYLPPVSSQTACPPGMASEQNSQGHTAIRCWGCRAAATPPPLESIKQERNLNRRDHFVLREERLGCQVGGENRGKNSGEGVAVTQGETVKA